MINEFYIKQSIIADRILGLEMELKHYKEKVTSLPMPLVRMEKIMSEIESIESLLQQNYNVIFNLCPVEIEH